MPGTFTKIGEMYARAVYAEARLARVQSLVNEQAEDEGLWFQAQTAPEAYLQQELRRLHAVIEAAALYKEEPHE